MPALAAHNGCYVLGLIVNDRGTFHSEGAPAVTQRRHTATINMLRPSRQKAALVFLPFNIENDDNDMVSDIRTDLRIAESYPPEIS